MLVSPLKYTLSLVSSSKDRRNKTKLSQGGNLATRKTPRDGLKSHVQSKKIFPTRELIYLTKLPTSTLFVTSVAVGLVNRPASKPVAIQLVDPPRQVLRLIGAAMREEQPPSISNKHSDHGPA